MTDLNSLSKTDLLKMVTDMQESRKQSIKFKVGDKGGLSVYGLGRFPVTLYVEQWEVLLSDEVLTRLRAFMQDNARSFKSKE